MPLQAYADCQRVAADQVVKAIASDTVSQRTTVDIILRASRMNAEIFPSNDVCMFGKKLRELRIAKNLSERELAKRMGPSWYRKRVQRLESMQEVCLHRIETEQLLEVLEQKV